jgi:ribosomal protein S5
VFNDQNASDPTHSVLSKVRLTFRSGRTTLIPAQDHFGIILNEPAGKVAKAVVEHSVKLIVEVCRVNTPLV